MHEGHRERFVDKVLYRGALQEHELLEILLYNAYPRRNTNGYAHQLIDAFGDLRGVLTADIDSLKQVKDVGQNVAEYIHCLGMSLQYANGCMNFGRATTVEQFKNLLIACPHKSGDWLEIYLTDYDFFIRRICHINADSSAVGAEVMRLISVFHAFGMYAAHVREGGGDMPNDADERIYNEVMSTCRICGLRMYDYCILRGNDFYSYYVNGKTDSL